MFRCCRASPQSHQPLTRINETSIQHPNRNKGSKIHRSNQEDDDVGDDLQAVKSWREQRRTTTTTPSAVDGTTSSTALVVYNGKKNHKLATIEEQSHEHSYSVNTSLSSAPVTDTEQQSSFVMNEEIDHIPQQPSSPTPSSPTITTANKNIPVRARTDSKGRSNLTYYNYQYDGSFPTLEEESWRKEQQRTMSLQEQEQQDEYLSSSSNSTIEDPILVTRPKGSNGAIRKEEKDHINSTRSEGAIDLDSERYDDNDKHVIVNEQNTMTKRPEPDDDSDRPVITRRNNHRGNSNSSFTQELSKEQPELAQASSTSSYTSILRDREPELNIINNSTESEELDAMIAAIDNSGSTLSVVGTVRSKVTPGKAAVHTQSTTSIERDAHSSPFFQPISSQRSTLSSSQSHSMIGAGSTYTSGVSSNSIKLSPNQRDSPSVYDPKSYMDDHYSIVIDKNEAGPTLISPSSDGSSIDPPSHTDSKMSVASTSRIGRDRHRTTQQSSPSNSNNNIHRNVASTIIPETAQERRKARSQSRGRRIRDRARSLLSTYNCQPVNHQEFVPIPSEDNYSTSTNNDHIVTNGAARSILTKLDDDSGNSTTFEAPKYNDNMSDIIHQSSDLSKESHQSLVKNETQPASLTPTTATTTPDPSHDNVTTDKVMAAVIDMDYSQLPEVFNVENCNSKYNYNAISVHLSDVPSDIDPSMREKYLKACRILKSSLLDKNPGIRPADKEFVTQLLEMSPSKEEDHTDDVPTLTEEKVKQNETSRNLVSHDSLQRQRSTPLFDAATTVISATDFSNATNGSHSTAESSRRGSYKNLLSPDNLHSALSGESSGVTEQELQIHNRIYMMNEQHHDAFPERSMVTPSETQVSSSVFSRVNDDYPYKVLSTVADFRPTVLLPWMMSALRGFLPLDVCEHHFWHKYSLHRETINNTSNIMELLAKVQGCKYTIICVETVGGSVFGTFCTTPWQIQSSWYGSGDSSFLWRLKHLRPCDGNSRQDNGDKDKGITTDVLGNNEIEIYPYTGSDSYIQYCTNQTMAVGGGTDWTNTKEGYSPYLSEAGTGIAFLIDGDLMGGETNSCVTFANPRLDHHHQQPSIVPPLSRPIAKWNERTNDDARKEEDQILDTSMEGNEFEIKTLEVYTLTKYSTVEKAEKS